MSVCSDNDAKSTRASGASAVKSAWRIVIEIKTITELIQRMCSFPVSLIFLLVDIHSTLEFYCILLLFF